MEHSIVFERTAPQRQENGVALTQELCSEKETKDKYVRSPIDKLGYAGLLVRHKLLQAILLGTPVLMLLQKRRTKLLNKMMLLFSFLGTEDFYTPVLCVMAWVIDMKLGRLMALAMATGFYTASLFKNILCLPRPPSPPVIPLEKAYDWSLPSHHSILGVVLPFYIFFYSLEHFHLSATALCVLFAIMSVWSFLVMFSRLYLGVHSPADIVCGGFMGCLLLTLILQLDDYIDLQCSKDYMAIIMAFIYCLLLLALHPQIKPQTMSFADTCCTTGVALGVVLASYTQANLPLKSQHINWSLLEERDNRNLSPPYTYLALMALGRVLIGFPMVLLSRSIIKFAVRHTLRALCQLLSIPCYSFSDTVKVQPMHSKHYTKDYLLPPLHCVPQKEKEAEVNAFDIDIPTKLITYACTGFSGFLTCMFLFYYMGLTLGTNGHH